MKVSLDLSTPNNYTYDKSRVKITDGCVRLKHHVMHLRKMKCYLCGWTGKTYGEKCPICKHVVEVNE